MSKFTINKNEFNQKFKEQDNIKAFVPVHLTIDKMCVIFDIFGISKQRLYRSGS